MSVSSWTLLIVGVTLFTSLFMLGTFLTLASSWIRYRNGSSSPYKLAYKARRSTTHDDESLSSRVRNRASFIACHSDMAVEVERDARQIIEKSSVFENWWDDEETQETKSVEYQSKYTGQHKRRFSTHPQYHRNSKKEVIQLKYLDEKNASLSYNEVETRQSICDVNTNNEATCGKYINSDIKGETNI